jgi:hypothetical protein
LLSLRCTAHSRHRHLCTDSPRSLRVGGRGGERRRRRRCAAPRQPVRRLRRLRLLHGCARHSGGAARRVGAQVSGRWGGACMACQQPTAPGAGWAGRAILSAVSTAAPSCPMCTPPPLHSNCRRAPACSPPASPLQVPVPRVRGAPQGEQRAGLPHVPRNSAGLHHARVLTARPFPTLADTALLMCSPCAAHLAPLLCAPLHRCPLQAPASHRAGRQTSVPPHISSCTSLPARCDPKCLVGSLALGPEGGGGAEGAASRCAWVALMAECRAVLSDSVAHLAS